MQILFQYRNIRHFLGTYITKQAEQEIYLIALVKMALALQDSSAYFLSTVLLSGQESKPVYGEPVDSLLSPIVPNLVAVPPAVKEQETNLLHTPALRVGHS